MAKQMGDNTGILLKSGTNEVEFIEFLIGDISYGVNVAKVQRVLARPSVKITKTDNLSKAILGAIYVQDKPITLIDLRKALMMPADDSLDPERQLILVTKFNKQVTAFLIDGVNKIHRTSWEDFEPIEDTFSSAEDSSYVTGTIKIDDRVVVILDLEHLMFEYTPKSFLDEEDKAATETKSEVLERRGKVSIIYAEDSSIIRKMMVNTLKKGGYTNVHSFDHGKAAYDYIESLRAKASKENKSIRNYIDCIITDIEMPQMDGLTLCRTIKEYPQASDIPAVIVYSSLVNEEMARKCQSVGADAQVSKPHGSEILEVLDKFCLK